ETPPSPSWFKPSRAAPKRIDVPPKRDNRCVFICRAAWDDKTRWKHPRNSRLKDNRDSACAPVIELVSALLSTREDSSGIRAPSPAGRIAQLVEQLTLNQRVPGSSPGAPTTNSRT